MAGYAELLLVQGFAVLMPDARAHGVSGGNVATYGLLEAEDIRRWFEWLQQKEPSGCVFGFAESMGAAELLQSLRSEPRFCAVAAESPFSSLREVTYDRVGQFFHTGPWLGRTLLRPIVEAAFLYARAKYRLDLERVSPENAAAATRVPVLLIHGRNDRSIPLRHSQRIAGRNPAVVLWEVANAGHCGAMSAAGQEFDRRLIRWFDSHSAVRRGEAVLESGWPMFEWVRRLGRTGDVPLAGAPAVRRVKSYSAASGYVYQYFYMGHRPAARGNEYVFAASSVREHSLAVSVVLGEAAIDSWQREHARELSASERYGIAKMALFRAFDERPSPAAMGQPVDVREPDVAFLAESLGLD